MSRDRSRKIKGVATVGRIRKAYAEIIYKSKDISLDLEKYLSSIRITDNLSGILDDIEIQLKNKNLLFLKPNWALNKKEKIQVSFITENFEKANNGKRSLPCGTFYIDDRDFSSTHFSIRGISAPVTNILDQKNSKHWENITLKALGEEFSNKHNLKFQYLVEEEIKFTSLDQDKETDLSFLNKIVEDEGISLKVTFDKLVLFNRDLLEKVDSKRIINLFSQELSDDWNFRESTRGIYDACEVSYLNLNSCLKEVSLINANGEIIENKENLKILKINKKSASGNIKRLAIKKLKQANRGKLEFNFSIIGDLNISSGSTFKLINAGIFNGKYMIENITRTLSPFRADISSYLIKKEKGEEYATS